MEFVILETILLLVILIGPLFFNPDKRKKEPREKPHHNKKLSDYGINEAGELEEIKKEKSDK